MSLAGFHVKKQINKQKKLKAQQSRGPTCASTLPGTHLYLEHIRYDYLGLEGRERKGAESRPEAEFHCASLDIMGRPQT